MSASLGGGPKASLTFSLLGGLKASLCFPEVIIVVICFDHHLGVSARTRIETIKAAPRAAVDKVGRIVGSVGVFTAAIDFDILKWRIQRIIFLDRQLFLANAPRLALNGRGFPWPLYLHRDVLGFALELRHQRLKKRPVVTFAHKRVK
jgi:hypothetical protein